MNKLSPICTLLVSASLLAGCVTQNYGNDKSTPIIESESNNNEIAMTRISLGLGYLKMGNTQQAKLNLEKAKRFSPNLVQVYTAFAHYYETVDEPNLAIKAYEKALSLNSQDADTLNNYGVFLCRQQQYESAEKKILQAIAIPSYILVAQSYENLALCQIKAKQFDKAQTYLDKAIAHSPNRASALLQMIQLQYAKSDYKLAQSYLTRYEKSTRRFSANALALAFKVYEKQGNRRTAKNYANMLVKMFPNSFEAKQYILNELYQIEADKLAREYQLSLRGSNVESNKKRVVVLSPKKAATKHADSLSQNGLKPLMANSVMATEKQESESAKSTQQKKQLLLAGTKQNTAIVSVKNTPKAEANKQVTENVSENLVENSASKASTENEQAAMLSLPIHIVKKGDSLFSISKKYNIVMKSIARWNKLRRPYTLKIGDVVYLANPKSAAKK